MPTPITAEELRAEEDKYLKVIGMEPSRIDEAVRASMPEIQELRGAYAIQPTAETNVYNETKLCLTLGKSHEETIIGNQEFSMISPEIIIFAIAIFASFALGLYVGYMEGADF